MKTSLRSAALALAVGAVLARGLALNGPRLEPELEPKSSKKFFGKDYPDDKRPKADKYYYFDHPYPAVQDTSDYDRDFVKDENADGGRWQAQMDYDTLRSKIRKAHREMDRLKRKLDEEEAEWNKSKNKLGDAQDAQEDAENARRAAEQAAGKASGKVNELEGGSQKDGTKIGGAVGDAMKNVEDEMSDLEKCKEELRKAKSDLKELMKQKEAADKQAKKDEEDLKKMNAEEQKKKNDADKAAKETEEQKKKETAVKTAKQEEIRNGEKALAEDEVTKRTQAEASWKKKLAEEQHETDQASKSYEEQLADVKRTEAELEQAAKDLRKYRRPPHVDDNGGVYNVPDEPQKSSAVGPTAAAVGLLLLVCVGL